MNNRAIKRRLDDLENSSTDNGELVINAWVCFCEPGQCTCPPADKYIGFDENGDPKVTYEKEHKKQN